MASPASPGNAPPWGLTPQPQYPQQPGTPRFEPAPLTHDRGMSSPTTWDKRLLAIPLVLFMAIGLQQCVSRMSRFNAERQQRALQAQRERELGIGPNLPAKPVSTKPAGFIPSPVARPTTPPTAACRLCTTSVLASGPVPRDSVASALDAAIPSLDQQCLTRRRRPGPAVVTFAFVVREGRATNRRIEGSSATDGTDECLLRGLADIGFPSSPDETEVTATFSLNAFR